MGIFKQIFGPTNKVKINGEDLRLEIDRTARRQPSFAEFMALNVPKTKEESHLLKLVELFAANQFGNKELAKDALDLLIKAAQRVKDDENAYSKPISFWEAAQKMNESK